MIVTLCIGSDGIRAEAGCSCMSSIEAVYRDTASYRHVAGRAYNVMIDKQARSYSCAEYQLVVYEM